MKQIGVVFGTLLLILFSMMVRVKTGWNTGLGPELTSLVLMTCAALVLSKARLVRQSSFRRFSLREVVIASGLIFGAIGSSASMNYVQKKAFGYTYVASLVDPKHDLRSTAEPIKTSIPEKVTSLLLGVVEEEITSRWIILGSLLMIMSPGLAIVLSSLIFAGTHLIVPILIGNPHVGPFFLLPTFAIGLFSGIGFLRYGLVGAISVHFVVNLCALFAQHREFAHISVIIAGTFAVITLIVLPLTLWFTRRREAFAT